MFGGHDCSSIKTLLQLPGLKDVDRFVLSPADFGLARPTLEQFRPNLSVSGEFGADVGICQANMVDWGAMLANFGRTQPKFGGVRLSETLTTGTHATNTANIAGALVQVGHVMSRCSATDSASLQDFGISGRAGLARMKLPEFGPNLVEPGPYGMDNYTKLHQIAQCLAEIGSHVASHIPDWSDLTQLRPAPIQVWSK